MRAVCGVGAGAVTLVLAAVEGHQVSAAAVGVLLTAVLLWCVDLVVDDLRALWRKAHLRSSRPLPGLALPAVAVAAQPFTVSARLVAVQVLLYAAARPVALHVTRSRERVTRVALMCSPEEAADFWSAAESPERHALPVLQVPVEDPAIDMAVALADLPRRCRREQVDVVLVGRHTTEDPLVSAALADLRADGLEVQPYVPWFEGTFRRTPLGAVQPAAAQVRAQPGRLRRACQRSGSLLAALPLLAVLLLVLPWVALAIVAESGRPVFFRQRRVGLGGRHFDVLKLRTMRQDAEACGPQFACQNDLRVTRVGRLLRRTRLDELPQVLNILRGEMTLIGPRPERPEFVAEYEAAIPGYAARLDVRPGLTGWAQVTEGYTSTLEATRRKLERDLFYVTHRSGRLNALILARTFGCVLRMSGR
jgi:lipopolysaccharide/colanic/teichoic acid biosynthesis glycosyltransferase